MINAVEKLLLAKRVPYDLTIQKLVAFYGLSNDSPESHIINIDDAEPLIPAQTGSVYLRDPLRDQPLLLPPLEFNIRCQGSEDIVLAQLKDVFGEPVNIINMSNCNNYEWRDGLATVTLHYYPSSQNKGDADACYVQFISGYRFEVKDAEAASLNRVEMLSIPAGAASGLRLDDQINLQCLRSIDKAAGIGYDPISQVLCASDGRQCALVNLSDVTEIRLLNARYRAQYSSSLLISYRNRYLKGQPTSQLALLACETWGVLQSISEEFAKRIGRELVIEQDEQDY